jgi:hypothetical protein
MNSVSRLNCFDLAKLVKHIPAATAIAAVLIVLPLTPITATAQQYQYHHRLQFQAPHNPPAGATIKADVALTS